jgi:hypothetical protein
MKTLYTIALLTALALTACGSLAPAPTVTPAPTATVLPTSTATLTPEPTMAPTETATQTVVQSTETPFVPDLPMPTGKPVKSWEGIPVMPNALAGEGDSQGYSFTVTASSDEVQKFYEKELAKLGWSMLANGQGTTGTLLLIFTKGTETVSMSILPQTDGLMYVLLVK